MAALRSLAYANAKDASAYGMETVYVQQHSSRWTLRIYRTDLEIEKPKRGLPAHVYGRRYLLEKVQNCVRLELVLRASELKSLKLNQPPHGMPLPRASACKNGLAAWPAQMA